MNLERLKRSRATVRQSTTRLINKLESEINKETDMSLDIIEEFLAQLNAKELSLHALDAEIEKSTDIENLDDEINQRENYNENIITWKIRANRILNRQNKSEIQSTTSRSNTTDTEIKSASQCTIKLPRLELKKFNGNILKFNEFWEQFDAAIHSNSTLSDVERFNYLKSYLQDEAEIAIRGLSLTSANYKTAVNILKERYGKKQLIIDAHMHKLLHLTAVKKSNDIAALRRLYAECEIQVRGLQNNGVEPNAYSCLLFPILMNAIPTDLSLEFSRFNHKNEETKITELLEFLKKEIECRERNENLKLVAEGNELNNKKNVESGKEEKYNVFKNKYQAKPFTEKERNFNRKIPTAATFYTNSSSHFDCIFCKSNNHDSESCPLSVVDRKKKLINQGNCFRCLRNGHRIAECFRKNICSFGRKHNKLICNCLDKSYKSKSRLNTGAETSESTLPFPPPESNAVTEVLTNISQSDEMNSFVYLQTCKCEVINNERIKAIRVMCDLGSTRSFCIRKCADELNLPVIAQEPLKLYSFGNSVAKLENMERVQIKLRNPLNHEQTFCLEAIITDTITRAQIPVPGEEIKNLCKEKGIELSPEFDERSDNKEISVLIGSDYLWEFYSGKVKRFSRNLVAVETRFGYCLSGTQNLFAKDAVSLHIAVQEQSELETDLSEQLNKFWNLESLGIQDRNLEFSKIDAEVMEEFEKNTTYDNLRYEVRLPWNSNAQRLANNFGIAKRRLVNLTKGFKEDYEYFKEYDAIIKDQINKGIAEEVALSPKSEEDPERVYFMPHHGVIRQEKIKTKLRIVYDCSSHEKGTYSLNSCLHPGPNLNPNLLTILLSFRKHKVAFISDIEKAFLMVSVSKEDRDCQRFLWFENPFSENFKVLRMARVTFDVSSSPFLLAATIKLHLRKYKEDLPMAVSILDENLYVDDLISGSEEIKDASLLTKQAKHIMEEASMKLRKWQTNSEELRQYWRRNKFDINKEENHRSSLKVLEIVWNSEEDTFKLDLSTILKTVQNPSYTKRGVLQTTCTIFDPIGFISPYVIRMKILFQKLWERGIKWDDELPLDLRKEWSKWCEEVSQLKTFTIPRTYYPRHLDISKEDTELHVFSDSSESGYGAVAFVRFASEKDFHISFVSSKARVAPLKRLTLPRLELMGAVIAARLASYLQQILEIKKKNLFLWTDSAIALNWIRGHASDWKPFVSNRVVEIQSLTDPCNWNHCSEKENPSDLLTRGCSAEKLLREEKWWNGPKWLMKDKTLWPKFDVKQPSKEKLERERRPRST